jgi:phage-related protein
MVSVPKPIALRFWKAVSGREPVRDWLTTLTSDDKRVVGRDLAKLQFGWPVGMPVCRALGQGLWEVRSSLPSGRECRIMICFHDSDLIALHGFIKKTQKTSTDDLLIARQRQKDLQS